MRAVIINADDLGACESTNRAIAEAHQRGILTSASVMVNGFAFDHAIETVVTPNPQLGIGLHLTLTSTSRALSRSTAIPLLADAEGQFRHGFLSLYRLTISRPAEVIPQIEHEVRAQFERLADRGVAIDHVDSHRHVHMIPRIFTVVARVARTYGCRTIRLPDEPLASLPPMLHLSTLPLLLGNLPKKIVLSTLARRNRTAAGAFRIARRTYGILGSGRMDRRALLAALSGDLTGVTEIITHPGSGEDDLPGASPTERRFLTSSDRRAELHALLDPEVRNHLQARAGFATRFADLAH